MRNSILITSEESDEWPRGVASVRVVYMHGWNVGGINSDLSDSDFDTGVNNLPADISLVALNAARWRSWRWRTRPSAGRSSVPSMNSVGLTWQLDPATSRERYVFSVVVYAH